MRRRRQRQERAVLAGYQALAPRECEVLSCQRIGHEPLAVLLVGGEALDGVDAVGERGRALVRRKVAEEVCAAARDGLAPVARVLEELSLLRRVDVIANDAGNHVGASPSLDADAAIHATSGVIDAAA